MIDRDDILAALESTAKRRKPSAIYGESSMPTDADIAVHRDTLLRFLEELDTDISVGEIIEALEDWK